VKRFATPAGAVAIFLLNVWLCGPLFFPGELPFRGSIEGGYFAMARFLSDHPNPWGWNPLPYCGLPTQFLYVPVLPYGTALLLRLLPHLGPDTVYRVIVSVLACLGPVTLFLFAFEFTRNRRWCFGLAVTYSVVSLSYALFPAVEKDRGIVQLPWRIQVLAKYGEGPHNAGLTLLPLALLALWLAATLRGYARIFAAALMVAAIPLTNWVAALSLAISCLLLLLAAWGEPDFRLGPVSRGNGRRRCRHPAAVPVAGGIVLSLFCLPGRIRLRMGCQPVFPLRTGYASRIAPLCHRIRAVPCHGGGGGAAPEHAER
jgi:hypothetical protein